MNRIIQLFRNQHRNRVIRLQMLEHDIIGDDIKRLLRLALHIGMPSKPRLPGNRRLAQHSPDLRRSRRHTHHHAPQRSIIGLGNKPLGKRGHGQLLVARHCRD
ncbi:MAG: hypothetical protein NVV77_04235 [Devosia sp.]|nr:hypothetical protein [Devosia sp.]MCR6634066.1 hypothetical protein [Devosia sp.]